MKGDKGGGEGEALPKTSNFASEGDTDVGTRGEGVGIENQKIAEESPGGGGGGVTEGENGQKKMRSLDRSSCGTALRRFQAFLEKALSVSLYNGCHSSFIEDDSTDISNTLRHDTHASSVRAL